MIRVAIVGCGKIADSHIEQLRRVSGAHLVGVCDREELMAKQLLERSGAEHYFTDVAKLLVEARPDVVHITTPPQSHFQLARQCLEHGSHVFVEKPFTLNTKEAEQLIELAKARGQKITVGHDDQFRHAARRMRQLIKDGYLGGPPVHMESYYCYGLSSDNDYVRALLGDSKHWVRSLPGGLLQNIISHGLARIAEFLQTDNPKVVVQGFVSPFLLGTGERAIIDELRVIISEDSGMTAYFTFSSQMRPSLHQFRIYGLKNGLCLDQDNETLVKLSGRRHKSYLEQFLPPFIMAKEYLGNLATNLRNFLAADFHNKSGMKYLFEEFYRSILNNTSPPINYREILNVARMMDTIFSQLSSSNLVDLDHKSP